MGSLLALASSILWGTADFLAGNLSKRFKALAVTGVSQGFGLLFGLIAIAIQGKFIAPDLSWSGYFLPGVVAGVAGFIGLTAFYTGLATGRMGVVSPISSLSVLIPLIVALSQGERPSTMHATTQGLVSVAMVLGSLFPIVTVLLAFKFLHERLHRVQYLGIGAALTGVIFISVL
ncbi:MAG: hypothetical protein EB105_01195 [Actinobacteria bacterium]|nr:hypothetical protein [Actinomycetota bacterium]